jgi:ketosteroid isomerase-like protein
MKPPIIPSMKSILSALTAVILIGLGSAVANAQTDTNGRTDEQLLRKLIQEDNEGKNVIKPTEDSIFVNGAYRRPTIGRAAREKEESRLKDISNVSRKSEVVRLAISQSGDMAEEFGNFTLSFDKPDKTHISFDGSYLRVWRKINGEWLEDAFFARRNEPEEKTKQKSGP